MAKKQGISFFILTVFFCQLSLLSCGNRNPNLSENRLLAIVNDTTQIVEEASAFIFPDTSYVPPAGAKFTEIRSIDPDSPPVTLKVSIPQGVKEPLKLSRFGSTVEYVTLRLPDDNDFFLSGTGVSLYFTRGSSGSHPSTIVNRLGDHYVSSDVLGIRLFDPSGRFVQNLLLSEFEGQQRNIQKIDIDFEGYKRASMLDISGTHCFLTFVDYEGSQNFYWNLAGMQHFDREGKGKIWVGEFDISKLPLLKPQSELPNISPGVEMVPVRDLPAGRFLDDDTRFNFRGVGNPIAITFNMMGDTLCKFANYEGSGGAYSSDKSFFYRADGVFYFRQEFCDTIFRVHSANRIIPAYCFDFGAQRLTAFEGATNKTLGKLMPNGLLDFKNSILLIFTEGRDCPACRTAGEVTFYCLLYDKKTGRPTAIDLKSRYPENILIENDLDGGVPIPLNTLHIEGNDIIATYTKVQIEEILKNNVGAIPAETVAKLKTLADTLKQNEILVMRVN